MVNIGPSADRIPHKSFGAAIDLSAYTNADRLQGIKITATSATPATITYKTKGSGATARTETVQAGDVLVAQFMSIDSVSGVSELVVMISDQT